MEVPFPGLPVAYVDGFRRFRQIKDIAVEIENRQFMGGLVHRQAVTVEQDHAGAFVGFDHGALGRH